MTLTEPETYIELGAPLTDAHDSVWQRLGQCGTWWTGEQRVAAMAEVRQALRCALCNERLEALSPMMVAGEHDSVSELAPEAVDLIHRLTTDPGRLSKEWALLVIESIGEEAYVELSTLVCVQYVVDSFARSLGLPLRELPEPQFGEPDKVRPEGVGDVGAWVSQTIEKSLANVSRAGSLVPETEALWREIVQAHYSRGPQFAELVWDRALSRPQVELLASTVSALNECFY
tara:strand:+ start:43947 stop:44639 length:693 start_codon:yes stop_codon:yes gene_type:complete